MPIVVNELLIKVSITDEEQGGGSAGGSTGQEGDSEVSGSDALVAACVEKVLEIIKEKEER